MAQDPPKLAASLTFPLLIVQGDQDLQVKVQDAQALAAAQPKAKLAIVPGVNHVLKVPSGEGRAQNMAAYADPSLPVAPAVIDAVAGFVKP
jgi:pimeloyl-ACP methyl ester carboxylesterase